MRCRARKGVALMCLAEALLRIPDDDTRDALIRDKIGGGDWRAHLGHSPSLFVNAATWGLLLTGRLTATSSEQSLSSALVRLIGRGGEPLIRTGVNIAMRLMGEQFVAGQTIDEALDNGRDREAEGFRHSYDMLGEAAVTAEQAFSYMQAYRRAIHAIGARAGVRGIYEGPASRSSCRRCIRATAARRSSGCTPSSIRASRNWPCSRATTTSGSTSMPRRPTGWRSRSTCWSGSASSPSSKAGTAVGFVVQAYQKRALFTIDWLIDLARRSHRRLMVRLVKGAYWDGEIKRAQLDGLEGYPVFTRRIHTDVSYLACARRLLAAPDAAFPAVRHAQCADALPPSTPWPARTFMPASTSSSACTAWASRFTRRCRAGQAKPAVPHLRARSARTRRCSPTWCAPAGERRQHLVRQPDLPVPEVTRSTPCCAIPSSRRWRSQPVGAPHPRTPCPRDQFGSDAEFRADSRLRQRAGAGRPRGTWWRPRPPAVPRWPTVRAHRASARWPIRPITRCRRHGGRGDPDHWSCGLPHAKPWQEPPAVRADAAAGSRPDGGAAKTAAGADRARGRQDVSNAVGEGEGSRRLPALLRGLRSKASRTRRNRPLGVVACISPWNFPLSIFTGQVAGALAAGNAVIAKPAEETPLIASLAVALLHEVGVPRAALQLLPGDGKVGGRLVADPAIAGVVFTGSTEVAQSINRQLAQRLNGDGRPPVLIAETGGQKAMVADSSALPEQLVLDAVTSAFDSAGQRCSALRVLCLQDDIADASCPCSRGRWPSSGSAIPTGCRSMSGR
jgi:RHH-type proline utilization regulon transcriptional repressor/proline dehydrogenase/delta 1-pyrroline-5-carboxylate dehydrogenase